MAATSGAAGSSKEGPLIFFSVPGVTSSGLGKSGKALVKVNNQEIVLVAHRGQIHAMQAKCPHRGGPLVEGEIEDLGKSICIKCPLHSWKFDIVSGVCVSPGPEADKNMRVYSVRVNNDKIEVGFPESK